jgi:hypothetical protein
MVFVTYYYRLAQVGAVRYRPQNADPQVSKTHYKVSDFITWAKAGTVILSPSFQRRSVWPVGAKS